MRKTILISALIVACGGETTCPDPQPVAVTPTSGDERVRVSVETPAARPSSRGAPAPSPAGDVERLRVPRDYAASRGPRHAPVTIVTFSDFECPFCRRVQPTLARIEEQYAGSVRLVFRHHPLPFHRGAKPAAIAAMEAYAQGGDALFWRMHDALFAQTSSLDTATILRLGREVGVDERRLQSALDDERWGAAVDADVALANSLGARGTPAFFINGRALSGAQPFERFAEIIDEEIRIVDALRTQGIAPEDVYATLTWSGRVDPAPSAPTAAAPRRQPDPDAIYRVPLTGNLPQRGPDDALVTIVTFSDFQCPFCARARSTVDQVIQQYGNDVRFVWMNNPLPFHQNALPAAELALEAHRQRGNRAFWPLHDVLFENQRSLDRASLERFAQQAQLDMAEVRAALDGHRHQATIEQHQQLARSLGATGTPAFFINGRNLRGAQPVAAFRAVIDQELTRARALVRAGTPRNRVYERATRDGATTPQFIQGAAPTAAAPTPPPDTVYNIAVPRSAPRRGARRAQVVIQEFADFQCPFCSRVQPTVDRIVQEYGDRVKLVWRDYPLPFHQQAHLAAEAAREVRRQAGDRGFWRYAAILFENQRELGEEKLIEYARRIRGVNVARFRRALNRRTHEAAVDADMQAVRDAGARIGTPSFFINGRLLQGAQPFEAFRDAIDRALREANP